MEYNQFSEKVSNLLKKERPKAGERVQFVSVNNEALALPATSLIYDEGKEEFIPTANSQGKKEVRDQSSVKDSLSLNERVFFNRENGFTQTIYGDRPDQLGLFDYLFLHPSNLNNKGKKGYKPPINGYKFKMNNPDAEAKERLEKEKLITKAKSIVFDMKDEELQKHGKALYPNYKYMSPSEIQTSLINMAKVDPKKVIGLSEDIDLSGKALIVELEEAGLIEFKSNKWLTTSNGEELVKVSPKAEKYKALTNYLVKNQDLITYFKDELEKANSK